MGVDRDHEGTSAKLCRRAPTCSDRSVNNSLIGQLHECRRAEDTFSLCSRGQMGLYLCQEGYISKAEDEAAAAPSAKAKDGLTAGFLAWSLGGGVSFAVRAIPVSPPQSPAENGSQ